MSGSRIQPGATQAHDQVRTNITAEPGLEEVVLAVKGELRDLVTNLVLAQQAPLLQAVTLEVPVKSTFTILPKKRHHMLP